MSNSDSLFSRRNTKLFFWFVISIFAIEVLSFLGWTFPHVEPLLFVAVTVAALVITVIKLEYGLLCVLAELFVGSFGYLFWFPLDGETRLPIRLSLFIIVLAVWAIKALRDKEMRPNVKPFAVWYSLIGLSILLGIIVGIARGNAWPHVFFDANGYLFFAALPVFVAVLRSPEAQKRALTVLGAAVIVIAIKTIMLLFVFSHQYTELVYALYRWVRDTRVGEITLLSDNYYRIFFQSDIWILVGLLLFSLRAFAGSFKSVRERALSWLLALCGVLPIMASLSRSILIGAVVSLVSLLFFARISLKLNIVRVTSFAGSFVILALASGAILYTAVNFPHVTGVPVASLFGERLASADDAALRSRWELLPAMKQVILTHPLIGSGFGTEVTYQASDPRVVAANGTGIYTTFSFEWGYFDFWMKMGVLGLASFLGLLYALARNLYQSVKVHVASKDTQMALLHLALLVALIGIGVTHAFSPYLNHPLGISFLLFTTAFVTMGPSGLNLDKRNSPAIMRTPG